MTRKLSPLNPTDLTKDNILELAKEHPLLYIAIRSFSVGPEIDWDKALMAAVIWLCQMNDDLQNYLVTLESSRTSLTINLANLPPDEQEKILTVLKTRK